MGWASARWRDGSRPARLALACLVLAATCAAAPLLSILPAESPAAAQSSGSDGDYEPCPSETETVDLLLMMDESGSLNGPGGVDPGGTQRREALQEIRGALAGAMSVRIALYGFDVEGYGHAEFGPASAQHPSDAEIEASMGAERHTDYGVALETALSAFEEESRPDSCRVLVWFTDGLHDPEPSNSEAEARAAAELRDRLCRSTKRAFEDSGIQTLAVLLGDSFRGGSGAADRNQQSMAEISLDVIRGITGHHDSPAVEGIPTAQECSWGNQRTGEILAVAGVIDLPNSLIQQTVESGSGFLDWSDCDRLRDGSRVSSNELPAGAYIKEILILAFGSEIERYGLLNPARADGASPDWRPLPAGSRRLKLTSQDLERLPAGWGLVLEVKPDEERQPNDGVDTRSVTLKCYSKQADQPLEVQGKIVNQQGERLTMVPADSTHTLRVDIFPYECPVDAELFILTPEFPIERVRNQVCEQGQQVDFEYYSGRPDEQTEVTSFTGELEPRFAGNLWGLGSKLEVEVATDFVVQAGLPPPLLDCDGAAPQLDGEWRDDMFTGRIEAATCRLISPADGATPEGTGTIEVEASGDVGYHLEAPDGSRIDGDGIPREFEDLPQEFSIVSEPISSQGLGLLGGEVQITLSWQLPGELPVPVVEERIAIEPFPLLDCDGDVPRLDGDWRVDEYVGRIVVATCRIESPNLGAPAGNAGSISVQTLWGGVSYYIETRGGRLDGNLQLVFEDLPREFEVVSGPIASQGPWELDGEVEITFEPPQGVSGARERILIPPLDPLNDYREWPTLECPDPGEALEPSNADDGEVPGTPLRVEAPCTASGPGMGELLLSLAWSPDPAGDSGTGVPESLHWRFAAGPGLGDGSMLILRAGDELEPLALASTESLPNTWIDSTGTVTIAAVWMLPWPDERHIAQQDLQVNINLLPRPIRWLAALMALVAALVTYSLLYAIVARSHRLPPPGNFYGTRLEFKTERRPTGLRSAQLDNFHPDTAEWGTVTGDRNHLRMSDLRIEAEHPRWWQITSILNGGWGRPSGPRGASLFGATPHGLRSQPRTTPAQFTELAVIALKTGGPDKPEEPDGIAYLLVPKRQQDRRLERDDLSNLLRGMTAQYDGQAAAEATSQQDAPDPQPPGHDPPQPPPRPGADPPQPPPRPGADPPQPPPRPGADPPQPPPRPGADPPQPPPRPGADPPQPPPRPGADPPQPPPRPGAGPPQPPPRPGAGPPQR